MPALKKGEMKKSDLQKAYDDGQAEITRLNSLLAAQASEHATALRLRDQAHEEAIRNKDAAHAATVERLTDQKVDAVRKAGEVQILLDNANQSLETCSADLYALRGMRLEQLLAWGFARQILIDPLQDDAREIFQLLAAAYASKRKRSLSADFSGDTAKGQVKVDMFGDISLSLETDLGDRHLALTLQNERRWRTVPYLTESLLPELGLSEVRPHRRIFARGDRAARFVGIFLTSMMAHTPPFPGPDGPITNVAFINGQTIDLDNIAASGLSPAIASLLSLLVEQLKEEAASELGKDAPRA